MSSEELKRYTRCGMSIDEDKKGGWVEYSDYAALEAECERLKNSLLEITTRHFAEGWKRSASEKQLEQYLSAGIAQLETERDALRAELASVKGE